MLAARRGAGCADSDVAASTATTTVLPRSVFITGDLAPPLQDSAPGGARGDQRQRQEEQSARHLRDGGVAVEPGERVTNRLERRDRAGADEHGEQNAADRSAGNQARAEQGAGAQFGFVFDAGA